MRIEKEVTKWRNAIIPGKQIVGIRLRLNAMLTLLAYAKDNIAYESPDQALKDIEAAEKIWKDTISIVQKWEEKL